ncbi:MAG: aspartate-semialdehyde dehydrogenase [Bacteroidales bacterium]|jgi:aspartate-semialdehyde dehydrogenase|nr:aspartate-semialdehyde dehydrogenase [Bacteroidales bacterium]
MKIGLVGATGLVGSVMLKVLEECNFGDFDLLPAASDKSVGKEIIFNNRKHTLCSVQKIIDRKPDIAIFSAGSSVSLHYAPLFVEVNCFVIDNSSAWRMFEHIPLIVPEINAERLTISDKIIANPNCSTIQMVMALAPLHKVFKIKRIVVSTYQSVTGTGMKAVNQLMNERNGIEGEKIYPHPIDMNILPHGGNFESNGYTTEETKLVNETRKILGDNNIQITATVVRVPVLGGHSEAVNIEFERDYSLEAIYDLLRNMSGIVVEDDPVANKYPMPYYSQGKNEVFVGRIRRDFSRENSLNMWIVSDNLRKGAATNAVQIAQYIIAQGWKK